MSSSQSSEALPLIVMFDSFAVGAPLPPHLATFVSLSAGIVTVTVATSLILLQVCGASTTTPLAQVAAKSQHASTSDFPSAWTTVHSTAGTGVVMNET